MERIKSVLRGLRAAYYTLMGGYPVHIKGENFLVDTRYIGFWKNVNRGAWEPESFEFLETYLTQDDVYIDIGAWVGPTAMFAAKKSKKVICFEPDPIAYNVLTQNIRGNQLKNIDYFNVAVAHYNGTSTMSSAGKTLGDTMTSLVTDHTGKDSFQTLVMSWNRIVEYLDLESVKMIKIDVEGAEFELIPSMIPYLKKYKPVLWLSIHPTFIDESERRVARLVECLSFYNNCYNDQMKKVDISSMLSARSMAGYPSYLFSD